MAAGQYSGVSYLFTYFSRSHLAFIAFTGVTKNTAGSELLISETTTITFPRIAVALASKWPWPARSQVAQMFRREAEVGVGRETLAK